MMDDYKANLEREYCVSILDKDSISNMETKGQQHVGANSLIYLSLQARIPFLAKRRRGGQIWRTFLVVFFSLSYRISLL
jgi:hypothetical protein